MKIKGFRGLEAEISFNFPITIITGLNGSGKSTIAQLALCAYKNPKKDSGRYYIKDFFSKTQIDPAPYDDSASVEYHFSTMDKSNSPTITTIIMTKKKERWGGYRRQFSKNCEYLGTSFFIPHHEQGIRLFRDPTTKIKTMKPLNSETIRHVARILSTNYDSVEVNTITNGKQEAEIGFASRYCAHYSENHMGCGEGRLIRMVDALEAAPDNSFFVIEEPETALHESAQHAFGQYLLDVCRRKKHQMVVTSHSSAIIDIMPSDSIKLVQKNRSGVEVYDNMTLVEVNAVLSGGYQRDVVIVVEDTFALCLSKEIIRKFEPTIQKASYFMKGGDYNRVKEIVSRIKEIGRLKVLGICDEPDKAVPTNGIFSFPETTPPEKTIFNDDAVKRYLNSLYGIDMDLIIRSCSDHHDILDRIAKTVDVEKEIVMNESIRRYIDTRPNEYYCNLIYNIRESVASS